MQYNTTLEQIKLPEFGRNIQKMVEHCKTIKDRKERQCCAETIVEVMAKVFPEAASPKENNPALWNQFAALAEYDIDIDFPVEIVDQDELNRPPLPIEYPEDDIVYRHYGHITQQLIEQAVLMPQGEKQQQFVELIARYMRNTFIAWGHSTTDSERILRDIKALSNGELSFDEERILDILESYNNSNTLSKEKVMRLRRKK